MSLETSLLEKMLLVFLVVLLFWFWFYYHIYPVCGWKCLDFLDKKGREGKTLQPTSWDWWAEPG